jgi:hypothetical protein
MTANLSLSSMSQAGKGCTIQDQGLLQGKLPQLAMQMEKHQSHLSSHNKSWGSEEQFDKH